jgi:hypothetical protein
VIGHTIPYTDWKNNMNLIKILILALTLIALPAMAEDHGTTAATISGQEISLMEIDHGFSGMIKNTLVFGTLDEESGKSTLVFKKAGKVFHADFQKTDGSMKGLLQSEDENGIVKLTQVEFLSVDRVSQVITVKIDNEEVKVAIKADRFENNHFYNPTYSAIMKGKSVAFSLAGGKACYNFSAHLVMMIFGAMAHL